MVQSRTHSFGGSWTEKKVRSVAHYLKAYTTALKRKRYTLIYIDAFAGTGERRSTSVDTSETPLNIGPIDELAKGSARVALEVNPNFDRYIFIEKSREKTDSLSRLVDSYPDLRPRTTIRRGEANKEIVSLCSSIPWARSRAVMFLDPYGMQVDWSTVCAIARTRAVDLWYLFPAGIGVNRMLPKSGNVPAEWAARLDRCFGTTEWREAFYYESGQSSLFEGQHGALVKDAAIPKIKDFFLGRLSSVFPGVSNDALPLYNSTNSLMYLLCFACGNPSAKALALRIAGHILRREH